MDRRHFIASAAALLVPVGVVSEEKLPPREFWLYSYQKDTWTRIHPQAIKVGDVIRVYDPPPGDGVDTTVHVSRVELGEDYFWSDFEIDPVTNQWV